MGWKEVAILFLIMRASIVKGFLTTHLEPVTVLSFRQIIDSAGTEKRLKAIEDELTRYRDVLEALQKGPVLTGADFDPAKMNWKLADTGKRIRAEV
jgi:hypothetical protein